MKHSTLEAWFQTLDGERSEYLLRAREAASLTIPSVLPQQGQTDNSELHKPFQNVGSDGVESIVSRLIAAMFPAGVSWFQFLPSARVLANAEINPEIKEAFRLFLYLREIRVREFMDSTNFRAKLRVVLENVIVAGNGLAKIDSDYGMIAYRPDQWVQERDSKYKIKRIIIKECFEYEEASAAVKAKIDAEKVDKPASEEDELYLYTLVEYDYAAKKWNIRQEVAGIEVARSVETVCPYFIVGYKEVSGSHYSRSFVELKMGDLRSLNGLSKAILDGATAAAKLLAVCDETKGGKPSDLAKPNGAVVTGRIEGGMAASYAFLTTNKSADLSVAAQVSGNIEQRLGRSMLLESAMQPTGDRVTATQITRIARELEGALGGVYAQIAEECQRPMLAYFLHRMEVEKQLEPLPEAVKDEANIQLLTGLEALGRQGDLDKLLAGVQTLAQFPNGLQRLKMDVVSLRVLEKLGVDVTGLLKSNQEIAQEQQAAIQQQNALAAGQEAAKAAGNIATEYAKAQAQPAAA